MLGGESKNAANKITVIILLDALTDLSLLVNDEASSDKLISYNRIFLAGSPSQGAA